MVPQKAIFIGLALACGLGLLFSARRIARQSTDWARRQDAVRLACAGFAGLSLLLLLQPWLDPPCAGRRCAGPRLFGWVLLLPVVWWYVTRRVRVCEDCGATNLGLAAPPEDCRRCGYRFGL